MNSHLQGRLLFPDKRLSQWLSLFNIAAKKLTFVEVRTHTGGVVYKLTVSCDSNFPFQQVL